METKIFLLNSAIRGRGRVNAEVLRYICTHQYLPTGTLHPSLPWWTSSVEGRGLFTKTNGKTWENLILHLLKQSIFKGRWFITFPMIIFFTRPLKLPAWALLLLINKEIYLQRQLVFTLNEMLAWHWSNFIYLSLHLIASNIWNFILQEQIQGVTKDMYSSLTNSPPIRLFSYGIFERISEK